MTTNNRALITLHSAVILLALSGLFAKWLTLPAIFLVAGRTFFAALSLFIGLFFLNRALLKTNKNAFIGFAITGVILCLHWVSFFQSIQLSSVAFGLLVFSCFPLIVSILEPLIFKKTYSISTFWLALGMILGVYLILPDMNPSGTGVKALLWGITSATTFAVLIVFNRKFVAKNSAMTTALYQNTIACFVLLPAIIYSTIIPSIEEIAILALLGIVFTALSHTMLNHALKQLTAFTASIAITLEPVYGVLAAWILLGEALTLNILLGGSIILIMNVFVGKSLGKESANKKLADDN